MSFSYEVCQRNSAMYPGQYASTPPCTEAAQAAPGGWVEQGPPRDADPGFRRDPAWVCTCCHRPVLDENGRPRAACPFVVNQENHNQQQEPDNWYYCDTCRQLQRDDKRLHALKQSARGTPAIDKVFSIDKTHGW